MEFLQKKEDKVAYLKGMVMMAKADGVIAAEEVNFIEAAILGMGLDDAAKHEIQGMWLKDANESLEFSDKANAAFFIQEAAQISFIDGHYDEREQEMVFYLGEKVGLNRDEVARIEKWVIEGIQWKKRGEDLISEIAGVQEV